MKNFSNIKDVVYTFYGQDGFCCECKQPLEGASCPYCGWDDVRPPQHKTVQEKKVANWYGITHYVPTWNWVLRLWKRWLCVRGWHLLDEYSTIGIHALFCDACEIMIELNQKEKT